MDRLAAVNAGQYLCLIAGLTAHLPKGERLPFLTEAFQTPSMTVSFSHAKTEEDSFQKFLMQLFAQSAGSETDDEIDIQNVSNFLKFAMGVAFDHPETSGEGSPVNQFLNDTMNGPCLAAAERRDPKGMAHLTAAASAHALRELTRLKHNNPVDLIETILSRLGDRTNAPTRAATYLGHLVSLLRPEEWPAVLESESFSALILKRPEILPAFFFPTVKAMDATKAVAFKEAVINSRSFGNYRATHTGKAQAIKQYAPVSAQKSPAGQSPAGP